MQNERKKLDFFKAEFYFLAQAEEGWLTPKRRRSTIVTNIQGYRFSLLARTPDNSGVLPTLVCPKKIKTSNKACFIFLAQREGFSPLAARPARQLLIAAFAVGFIVNLAIVGKAFCSRKTAPTLESLRKI